MEQDKIIDLIWKWIKSPNLIDFEANRTALLQLLLSKEQEYLLINYHPKEHQFVWAFTWSYPNLGINSKKHDESYHNVIKILVNRQMLLAESVRQIRDYIKNMGVMYDEKINTQHAKAPRLLYRMTFSKIKQLLNWNALDKFILFFVFIIAHES